MKNNLNRFRGQYIREDAKIKKPNKRKGIELQQISLCIYSHNGKLARHGGAL